MGALVTFRCDRLSWGWVRVGGGSQFATHLCKAFNFQNAFHIHCFLHRCGQISFILFDVLLRKYISYCPQLFPTTGGGSTIKETRDQY